MRLNTSPRFVHIPRLALGLLLMGVASFSFGQSFVNSGFESPVLAGGSWAPTPSGWGWSGQYNVGIANGSGSWGTGAHSGNQYAYVESDGLDFPGQQGWMEQTVSGFELGKTYQVEFWMARRNGDVGGNDSNPVEVILNGATVLLDPTYAPDPAWNLYQTSTFVAASTSNTIRFQTTQTGIDSANLIDDVSIQAVPEPTTLAAFGLGAVALLRRRRSKA